jgi:hypothetical protein
MVVGGVQQVLYFSLNLVETVGLGGGANLANGLSLLLVGTPVWAYAWWLVGRSLADPEEVQSTLRLVVLYGLSFIGVGGVLIPAGLILNLAFRLLLGEAFSLSSLLAEISGPVAAVVPFGAVWFYYGRRLTIEVAALPDTPRRAGMRRLYFYILSFVGLVAVFFGLHSLLSYIVDLLLQPYFGTTAGVRAFRERLSLALATLAVGLPLWFFTWRPMVAEATQPDEAGDHARRSLVRKVYLYLVVFAGVIGVMVSGGTLIYQVLRKVLGNPAVNFQRTSWMLAEILLLFAAFLAYHLVVLVADGRKAAEALAARHEAFPVLVLVTELGDFAEEILESIQREAPTMPVAVHLVDQGIPDEALSQARAVILPGEISSRPSESIRIWLREFTGARLVVPTETEDWMWVYGSGRSLSSLAAQTAKLVRQLAEGEEPPKVRDLSAWNVIVYILAGLVGIPLLIGLFAALGDLFN